MAKTCSRSDTHIVEVVQRVDNAFNLAPTIVGFCRAGVCGGIALGILNVGILFCTLEQGEVDITNILVAAKVGERFAHMEIRIHHAIV